MARQDGSSGAALREAQDRFITLWGRMAGAWGVSRTMAEILALLYISGDALCTDDVMDRLAISRGNASMSMRALLDWGIVERARRRGDRKEYFRAQEDVWALFRAIVRERLKREVDPLLASLYELRDMTAGKGAAGADRRALAVHHRRLDEMLEFFRALERFGSVFVSPAGHGLRLAASLMDRMPQRPDPDRPRP